MTDNSKTTRPGWVLAPLEPTRAMIEAAMNRKPSIEGELLYAGIWRAMITAAEEGVSTP